MNRSLWLIGLLSGSLLLQGSTVGAQPQRPGAAPRPRQIWAVIVGVGTPLDPKARAQGSLEPVQQALSVLAWLSGTAGWDRSHLLLLTDLGGNPDPGSPRNPAPNITPTRRNLDWAFRTWLASHVQPGDVILFYFAGQARAQTRTAPMSSPEYYFLPTDGFVDNLPSTGWSLDRALDGLAKQGKYQIVCWLGTTLQVQQAGAAGKQQPADLTRLSRDWLRRLARWPGVTVWLASDHPPVVATANPAVPFTAALLAGLGTKEHKANLATCLQFLHRDSKLKLGGFQTIGGVPPDLSLWVDQLGAPLKQPRPEMVLQVGHADRILDIVSTPDSRMVITASQDSTIRVWSPAQKALLRVLTGHEVGTTALGISTSGRWLVSGGGLGEVLVHDLADDFARRPIARQPSEQGARIHQIEMLPDGNHFVTVDRKGDSFLWDLGKPSLTYERWIEGVGCRKVASGGGGGDGAVAALCSDGTVRLFGAAGDGGRAAPLPGGPRSTVAVSPDGRLLGVGYDDGRVVVRDKSGSKLDKKLADSPVQELAFSASGFLAVGDAHGLRLIEIKDNFVLGAGSELVKGNGPVTPGFSRDGSLLAACIKNTGELRVWRLEADSPPRVILGDAQAGVLTLAFSSDGRELITGGKDGSIKTWKLDDRRAVSGWTSPASRGKIQHLSASPSRRLLLMANELHQAHLWDLARRSCRRLNGAWSSGVFLSDDTLVLAGRPQADQPGKLVRIDSRTLKQDGAFFAQVGGRFQVPGDASFEVMTLSADGRRVAASAGRFQAPLVCVWETATGRLTHWIAGSALLDPVFSLSFSSNGRELATAGDSPVARLWDLSRQEGALETPAVTFEDPSHRDVTCVQVRPGGDHQLVSGHSDGRLLLWSWQDGSQRQNAPVQTLAERFFTGSVRALSFTADGRYLAGAGSGTMIWLAEMEPRVRPIRDLGTPPHHFEQINALTFWPDWSGPLHLALLGLLHPGVPVIPAPPRPPVLISGSDDTTIRFWDIRNRSLLAAFCAASTQDDSPQPTPPGVRELDWVLYTPDGHFDASPEGRELVRFRRGESGERMEQFDSTKLYSFGLTDSIRLGRPPEPVPLESSPPVAIDPPLRDDPTAAETRLTVSLGSPDLTDLRLYHNGVPVASGLEDIQPPLPERHDVQIRLIKGVNRFYAMASREGAFDSRSQEVEVFYDGPLEPGRLHVIALGVGNYERERLTFAKRDAEQLSQALYDRRLDPGQETGNRILLTDNQVSAVEVAKAFSKIARDVKGHPQDTVVLFLAGHAGVFDGERFCLLLPKYPFPADSPLVVASRSADPPLAPGAKLTADHLLPVSVLTVNLMRMDALNRLVIVDACQAEAILSDPQVNAIRKWMEIGSRKARTSYLMATRRGESALEVEPLRHGLFTYTLLRGMGEISPREEQPEILSLKLRPDADYNNDGVITIAELDAYTKEALPPIAELFPDLVVRRAAKPAPRGEQSEATRRLEQSLRLQTAQVSFPLIRMRRVQNQGP